MSEKNIGIFRAETLDADASGDVLFFSADLPSMLKSIHDQAAALTDAEKKGFATPIAGLRGTRIGEVVVSPIEGDTAIYEIKADDGDDEDTAEKAAPSGEAGAWVVQSLIFSKDDFSLDEARSWIGEHDEYADHGVDETETSYRFRQYDPEYFSKFRTIVITDGIKAIYGQIATEKRKGSEAQQEAEASLDDGGIADLNSDILKRGVRLIEDTQDLSKGEDEAEERFVLGLVLEPNDGDDGSPLKPDTQGDVYSEKTIRDTAHGWMERYGGVDLMHSWEALGAGSIAILESYLAPVDFEIGKGEDRYTVCKGTWLLALRVLEEKLWQSIKAGDIGAFSVGGKATRTPLEDADTGEK